MVADLTDNDNTAVVVLDSGRDVVFDGITPQQLMERILDAYQHGRPFLLLDGFPDRFDTWLRVDRIVMVY